QPEVIERGPSYKILRYEGGHRRLVHYDPHSVRYYDFPVRGTEDLERLELPDMRDPVRFQDVAGDARVFRDAGFVPTGSIQGFFSGIHNSFMEFVPALENLLLEPSFMRRLTEQLARMSLNAAEMYLERGVEVIDVCDDLGNADGLLISPALFADLFLPWYAELARVVHARGGWVHLHSHGNIAPVMEQLVSAGIDIINPFDWHENPDLPGMVRRWGDRVVICGGSVGDLYRHPIAEVERIVRRACGLAKLASRGYLFMGNAGMEELSVEEWNQWREIFRRVREEELGDVAVQHVELALDHAVDPDHDVSLKRAGPSEGVREGEDDREPREDVGEGHHVGDREDVRGVHHQLPGCPVIRVVVVRPVGKHEIGGELADQADQDTAIGHRRFQLAAVIVEDLVLGDAGNRRRGARLGLAAPGQLDAADSVVTGVAAGGRQELDHVARGRPHDGGPPAGEIGVIGVRTDHQDPQPLFAHDTSCASSAHVVSSSGRPLTE
ncbi:MAG: hypothetical protein NTU62_13585, partial [Spirochaetes bacterium]|nr:hypothetical protein [Spirochaetota bacterium]